MEHVSILSDTKQEFMGTVYYLCGYYFQRRGERLHRAVWEHFNGPIPEGYHVHHIDGDRTNNQIDNLALMPGLAHVRQHAQSESRRENGRKAIKIAIQVAPAWHKSEEGRRWHSENAKKRWAKAPVTTYVCDICGEPYATKCYRELTHHLCGQNCRAKYRRRHKAGLL